MKPTETRPQDTLIQRKSKLWASKTVLAGEPSNMMIAYQMGAKQMEKEVLEAMFDKCDKKEEECSACEDCYGCALYCKVIKLFSR